LLHPTIWPFVIRRAYNLRWVFFNSKL